MCFLKRGLFICFCILGLESKGQNQVFIPSEYYLPICNPIIYQDSQLSFRSGLSYDISSFYFHNVYSPVKNFGIHAEINYAPFDIKTKTLFGSEYTTHQSTLNFRFGLSYSNIAKSGIWSLDAGAYATLANRQDSFSNIHFLPQEVHSLHVGALIQNNINLTHSTLVFSAALSNVSILQFNTWPDTIYADIKPALFIEPSFSYLYHLPNLPVLSLFFQTHVSYSLRPFEQEIGGSTLSTQSAALKVRAGFNLNLRRD